MSLLILLDEEAGVGSVTLTTIDGGSSATVEKRGGRVVQLVGTGFSSPMIVELEQATVVKGTGYIFDPEFDLTPTTVFVGLPALAIGTYDIRVTVGAANDLLVGAVITALFSEEDKVHQARRGFDRPWQTGPRILTNNILDLGAL